FQISDSYVLVENGKSFKELEVTSVSSNSITLKNDDSISLTAGNDIDLLGNIWLRVADDSSSLRYFPYVPIEELQGGALPMSLDVLSTVSKGLQLSIHVVSGISDVEGASIYYDGTLIGTTNVSGVLTYTPTDVGTHTIEAKRYGYASTSKQLEVIGDALELTVSPESLNLGETLVVQVGQKGSPVEGVSITLDNETIGTTNTAGVLSYTTTEAGTFTLRAQKAGYLPNSTELEVIGPYARLVVSSLSVEPRTVKSGQSIVVTANITNTGNILGTEEMQIKLDGVVVYTENLTLAPGTTFIIEHSQKVEGEGTHTLEVGGSLITVMAEGSSFPVLGAVGAVVGAGAVIVVLIIKGIIPLGVQSGEVAAQGTQAIERIREALQSVLKLLKR
ncbi:MAG: S-layer protein domain-containing protein, partial [Methermicoccaceae archaeon]